MNDIVVDLADEESMRAVHGCVMIICVTVAVAIFLSKRLLRSSMLLSIANATKHGSRITLQNAVVVTAVLLLLGISGVAADKPRPWRKWPDNVPWSFNMPSVRSRHTMVKVADGSLWMFGGGNADTEGARSNPDTLAKLDIEDRQWTWPITPAGPSPSPRFGHAATAVGYDMYVNGNGEFWKFSTLAFVWTQISYAGPELIRWKIRGIVGTCKRPSVGREVVDSRLALALSTRNIFDRQTWDQEFGNIDLQDGDFILEPTESCYYSYELESPKKAHPQGPLATVGHDIYTIDMHAIVDGLMKFDTQTTRWTDVKIDMSGASVYGASGQSLTAVGTSLYLFTPGYNTLLEIDTVNLVSTSLPGPQFVTQLWTLQQSGGALTTIGNAIYALEDEMSVWKFDTVGKQWNMILDENASPKGAFTGAYAGLNGNKARMSSSCSLGWSGCRSVTAIGNELIVFGGSQQIDDPSLPGELWRFKTSPPEWEELGAVVTPWMNADRMHRARALPDAPPRMEGTQSTSRPTMTTVGTDVYVSAHEKYDAISGAPYGNNQISFTNIPGNGNHVLWKYSTSTSNSTRLPGLSDGQDNDGNSVPLVTVGNDIYTFLSFTAEVLKFDTATEQWSVVANGSSHDAAKCSDPSGTCCAAAEKNQTCRDGYIPLLGGPCTCPAPASGSTGSYNCKSGYGCYPPGLPPPDYACGMGVLQPMRLLNGASNPRRCTTTANGFPVQTSVTAVGPDLYVNEQGRLWSFSTSQSAWTQMSGESHPTDPLVAIGNGLYTLSPDTRIDRMEVWKYDAGATVDANGMVIERPWTKIAAVGTPPRARIDHSMAVDGTDLYVFGGAIADITTMGTQFRTSSNDLSRFSLLTHEWSDLGFSQMGSTPPLSGGPPVLSGGPGQSSMTSVRTSAGTDLYLFSVAPCASGSCAGATHESDLFVRTVPGATHEFQPDFGPLVFARFYDGDIIHAATSTSSARPSGSSVGPTENWEVRLCSHLLLPCSLQFVGTSLSSFVRHSQNIVCQASDGCTGITLQNAVVQCDPNVMAPSAPFQVSGAGAALRIEGSTFTDCRSMEDGGAVRAYDGATVNISGSTFQRSASQGNGGAAALLGARATVNGTRFEACTSDKSGGAAFSGQYSVYPDVSRDSVVLWEGCAFEANTASQSGGALAAEAQSVVTVRKNCIFTGNSAAKGGALSVDTQSVVVLEDATLVSNTADEGGGMMLSNASAVIQGSRLDGNTAQGPIGGAALRVSASTVELFNNVFTNNVAENGGGGAILWDGKQSATMAPIVHLSVPSDSTFFVTFTMTMPYTTSEFDIGKQSKYKAAVASAAGTVAANVDILSITGTRRRAGKVDVETKIRSRDAAGVDAVSSSLGSGDALRSKIDQKLMEQGLQASAVKPAPGGKQCFARIHSLLRVLLRGSMWHIYIETHVVRAELVLPTVRTQGTQHATKDSMCASVHACMCAH